MQKGNFRKTALAIAMGGLLFGRPVSLYADDYVEERILDAPKKEGRWTSEKKLKSGFQYLYRLRGDSDDKALQTNGVNLIHDNGYTDATGAVIVYDTDDVNFAIQHEKATLGLRTPVIRASGVHHGIWVNANNVDIGNTIIRGLIIVDDGDAYRIDGSITGGSLYVGSKGELSGKRAISATATGSMEDLLITVRGNLTGTGGTAIDFSASPKHVNLMVDGGFIDGDILGSTTSTDDKMGVKGSASLLNTITDVDTVYFAESSSFALVHEDITMSSGNASVIVQDGGKVSFMKSGTQNIDGSLELQGKSSMKILTDGTSPALNVTGNFTQSDDASLMIKRSTFTPGRISDDLVIIQAANVSLGGLPSKGIFGNPLIKVGDVKTTSTEVTADVTDKTVEEVVNSVEGAGESAREGLETLLNVIVAGDGEDALGIVSALESNAELGELASEIRVNNAEATQRVNHQLADAAKQVVMHRMSRNRMGRGIGTGDSLDQDGFWMQALDADITQDNRMNDTGGKIFGYDADLNGVSIGYETERDNWTMGGAFTLANTSIDKQDSDDHSTVKNYQITLYGSWDNGPWFVDGLINMGLSRHDRNRYLDGFSDDVITADFDSKHYGLRVLAGMDYSINSVDIQPVLGFNYGLIQTDRYKEKGFENASDFAKAVDKQTHQRIELGAGVALSETFTVASGEIEPAARLMAWYDVKGEQVETTSRYLIGGRDYVVKGADPVKESYQGTVSVTYRRNDNFSFVVGYSRDQNSGYHSNSYFGRIQYDF